jgi:CHAT domain-containing protein
MAGFEIAPSFAGNLRDARQSLFGLLDGLDIAYVQSLAVHEELTARARKAKAAAPSLLTLADPDYTVIAEKVPSAKSVPRSLAAAKWPPLPGTRAESTALLRLYPGAQQRLGVQASRKQLNQLQQSGKLTQYRILHFATHGYVDDERSALVLSMADGPDQGYLQDTDVLDLQLNSDLVLLSACDTGIGRNISGEGVMGLPYAFMLAGNSNTLMSLWPVDDAGTAAFMTSFMTKVRKGDELLAALNQTKREFARGAHGKAFSDPRIWAALVQYGVGIAVRE